MTILANALLSVPAGANIRTAQAIPGGLKQPGIAQKVRMTFDAATFPPGVVTIAIGISTDNGASFREAEGTYTGLPGRGTTWFLEYELDEAAIPTNARLRTDSPSAFQTQTLIEVL